MKRNPHYYRRLYVVGSGAVNRPVRMPTELEARKALALDLCRTLQDTHRGRAELLLWLPLMQVALDGVDGMAIAEHRALEAA